MVVESASLPDQGIELMRGEVIKQSRKFLDEYDSLLLHKELYRSLFLYTLESVRDDVVKLLQRFISLPTEPFQHGVIECCGISFEGKKEYTNHYQHVHNLKAVQFVTLCEMKLALAKIAIFQRTIHGYLRAGNLSSCEMIYFLKQVLKKLNNTIDF
ncbi:hypothetical protein pipiens_017181 [Culex pipiens pipiens]|uniref:C2H2-type domain-containing protein n=1 Tax=Culex pipiens pipiens TaxID=38569 RepID=A0ABD1CHS8_CULPP